jgi:putative Mg2+ transporter-C (MgtC) family protein
MADGRLSVRGLNTAATLWCSAAVGCLAGSGLFVLASFGTLGVVGVNLLLRPLGRRLDQGTPPVCEGGPPRRRRST